MMTKIIHTNKKEEILVDDEDYDYLNQFKWTLTNGYVKTSRWINKRRVNFYMAREITKPNDNQSVSYKDGNNLNNQKANLVVSDKDDLFSKVSETKLRGAYKSTQAVGKPWKSQIRVGGKDIYLGVFDTPEEANKAYLEARQFYRGSTK